MAVASHHLLMVMLLSAILFFFHLIMVKFYFAQGHKEKGQNHNHQINKNTTEIN